MKKLWLRWLVLSVMLFNFGAGTVAMAQGITMPEGGLTVDVPLKGVGNTICNVAKSARLLLGGAIVAALIIFAIFRYMAGDTRGSFGLGLTAFFGAVLLATMPQWIGGLITGCAL